MFIEQHNNFLPKTIRSHWDTFVVFLSTFLLRLPSLGYDFINNDAFHWKNRGYEFTGALTSFDFGATAVTYHPGVPLLWSQFFAIKTFSILTKFNVIGSLSPQELFLVNHQIQKIWVVLLTSILLAILYKVIKSRFGVRIAIATLSLVVIEPFFLALSRAIHTDVMISLFMFISVLYYFLGRENNRRRNFILAGIFAGLAFLTKSSALFLVGYFGLVAVYDFFKEKSKQHLINLALTLAFAVLTFFVVWPAMWVDPVDSINIYLFKGVQGIAIEEGHSHIWFGKETLDPGATFYPIAIVGRYSLALIALSISGLIYFIFKERSSGKGVRQIILLSGLYVVLYLLMLTLASKKLDRYSLPVVIPLALVGTVFASRILSKKVLFGLLGILIISRVLLFIGIHPNYLAYYSPLIGGVQGGRYIIEPKWLVGYDEVAKYFNKEQESREEPIKVAIADFDYLRPFANFEVLNIKNEQERDEAEYFVLPVYREERNEFYKDNYELEKISDVIKIAGVEYYEIYLNEGKESQQ